MSKRRFLISSLAMAGIAPIPPGQATSNDGATGASGDDPGKQPIFQRFAQDHRILLAQHRSHSSHASHSSHRSGSSGTVRAPRTAPAPPRPVRTTPAPAPAPAPSSRNQRSTPPSSVLPSSPAIAPASQSAVKSIVMRVQLGLQAYGYYNGAIDGIVGKGTRAALVRFQTDYNLKVTGTITPEVLDAFKISAQ